jgi:hypothetical protein
MRSSRTCCELSSLWQCRDVPLPQDDFPVSPRPESNKQMSFIQKGIFVASFWRPRYNLEAAYILCTGREAHSRCPDLQTFVNHACCDSEDPNRTRILAVGPPMNSSEIGVLRYFCISGADRVVMIHSKHADERTPQCLCYNGRIIL